MVLVNGAEGIGTGFSTKIPPYNPSEIIKNIRNIMNGDKFESMDPWWQGFEGVVSKIDDFNYEIYGTWSIDDNKMTITELPVGQWTYNYKEFLEKMLEDVPLRGKPDDKKKKVVKKEKENPFLGYKDSNTDTRVHFELTFEDGYLDSVKDIDKLYHLYKKYSITNMHLYGPEGHIKRYDSIESIMRDYYKVRLQLYQDRKLHQLSILEHQLTVISNKVRFILMVVEKKLEINNKKKTEIEEKLEKLKFPRLGKNKDDTKISYDYLLSMPIYNLTMEKIEELKEMNDEKTTEYNTLNAMKPETIWSNELDILETKYDKWYKKHCEEIDNNLPKKKVKKSKK
jgi:DNA topoisomerase-2